MLTTFIVIHRNYFIFIKHLNIIFKILKSRSPVGLFALNDICSWTATALHSFLFAKGKFWGRSEEQYRVTVQTLSPYCSDSIARYGFSF
jgi:hypothetical protein